MTTIVTQTETEPIEINCPIEECTQANPIARYYYVNGKWTLDPSVENANHLFPKFLTETEQLIVCPICHVGVIVKIVVE